jgi:hypothetical protein
MADKIDKVIVTNLGALRTKYRQKFSMIQKAITALITADQKRGLRAQLVAVDDSTTMRRFSARPVARTDDPAQNKAAVDAIYKALAPDYLMILGSIDVVPHQDLKNPLYGNTDPDPMALGDIPYACEAPYSKQPQDFVGPTRVVGRLPDITNSTDPAYIVNLLNNAASYKPLSQTDFTKYFAVSAQIWQKSSDLSVVKTFGNDQSLHDVPPDNSEWSSDELRRMAHFFNCHGASLYAQFFGQPADGSQNFPVALDAEYLDGKTPNGAVAAAECCYGGQLYDPAQCLSRPGQAGICNTYLGNGAWGFLGSTTIAYGPPEGNAQADLMCQYFLQSVLTGASLGRATLEARQQFVAASFPPDPSDIKTLAQFNLYGDPSITPVHTAQAVLPSGVKSLAPYSAERSDRHDRRRFLFRHGISLTEQTPVPRRAAKARPSILNGLKLKSRELGMEPGETLVFTIRHHPRPKSMPNGLATTKSMATGFHVLFAQRMEDTQTDTGPRIIRIERLSERKSMVSLCP